MKLKHILYTILSLIIISFLLFLLINHIDKTQDEIQDEVQPLRKLPVGRDSFHETFNFPNTNVPPSYMYTTEYVNFRGNKVYFIHYTTEVPLITFNTTNLDSFYLEFNFSLITEKAVLWFAFNEVIPNENYNVVHFSERHTWGSSIELFQNQTEHARSGDFGIIQHVWNNVTVHYQYRNLTVCINSLPCLSEIINYERQGDFMTFSVTSLRNHQAIGIIDDILLVRELR